MTECQCALRTLPIDWNKQSEWLYARFQRLGIDEPGDLVRESLRRSFTKCCKFDPNRVNDLPLDGRVAVWLRGFARKIYLEFLAKEQRRRQFSEWSEELKLSHNVVAPFVCDDAVYFDAMQATISELSAAQRETVRLHFQGFSPELIAKTLSISCGTVNKRLSRFRQTVRAKLGSERVEIVELISNRTRALLYYAEALRRISFGDTNAPPESRHAWLECKIALSIDQSNAQGKVFQQIFRLIPIHARSVADSDYAYEQLSDWVVLFLSGFADKGVSLGFANRIAHAIPELGSLLGTEFKEGWSNRPIGT